tara:strand:+ start:2292 stop:2489 length:198 start_codon:yes stop_codon:yes gene_type:complete
MIYAIARKISTQECYNNEYEVISLHDSLDEAINLSIASGVATETTNTIRIGDSINSNGDAWQRGG